LSVYAAGILGFGLFRLVLLVANWQRLTDLPGTGRTGLILRALLMGFRFDTVVSGYILALPVLIFWILLFTGRWPRLLIRLIMVYTGVFYSLAFFLCAVDIPYYSHFSSRLTHAVFAWMDSPRFIAGMIFHDSRYFIYFLPLILVSGAFWLVLLRSHRRLQSLGTTPSRPLSLDRRLKGSGLWLLVILILFVGIRGRLVIKSPIRVGTAYFSNYGFPNQLGLNPVFTFTQSVLSDMDPAAHRFAFVSERIALKRVRRYLDVKASAVCGSPVGRRVEHDGPPLRANVVLVIMESMAYRFMESRVNGSLLTPNLVHLMENGIGFDHIYSSGVHTYAGIYSTLFGFPVLMRRHPLKATPVLNYEGLPAILKSHGYRTAFFTTHDDQFDNMGGFLRANGFEKIVSRSDYPSRRVTGPLGVPDDFMFEFSLPILDSLAGSGGPFLAVLLTSSNHPPYAVPREIPFEPRGSTPEEKTVSYADWAIGKFVDLCRGRPWFDDTLFVFVGDNGRDGGGPYAMSLSLHHTPLIYYAPRIFSEPRRYRRLGGQIDVFPTLLGILDLDYVNTSLGIDLRRARRPFVFFSSDDKIGCLNRRYFMIWQDSAAATIHHYRDGDPADHASEKMALMGRMKRYTFAMLQVTQWLVCSGRVGCDTPPRRR